MSFNSACPRESRSILPWRGKVIVQLSDHHSRGEGCSTQPTPRMPRLSSPSFAPVALSDPVGPRPRLSGLAREGSPSRVPQMPRTSQSIPPGLHPAVQIVLEFSCVCFPRADPTFSKQNHCRMCTLDEMPGLQWPLFCLECSC